MSMKLSQVKDRLLEITKCNEFEFSENIVKLYFYGNSYITKTSISMLYGLIDFFNLRRYDWATCKTIVTDEQIIIEHHIAQADINDDESVVDCIITIKHDLKFHE
jgi:hypothetical protein